MTCVNAFYILFFIAVANYGLVENKHDSTFHVSAKCSKGQIEWCKNFLSAIECNAVKHCVQTVWLKTKSIKNENSCVDCKNEVDEIRKGINSNTTKEVLRDVLDNLCHIYMPLLNTMCKEFLNQYVDNYSNELLDLLNSEIDSESICRIFLFCTTEPFAIKDDVVVHYKNIILHLPAGILNVESAPKLLGSKKCTWGPSYWCNNITSCKECRATSHCIKSVWSKIHYEEDTDSVCQVCKNMVKQARDQLLSNETQEELKEVFEGSCKLIPIKEIRKQCMKLADEFVPELTEMVTSQLNPTAVCTVAGLCNSIRIDNLLATSSSASDNILDSCSNCTIAFRAVERYLKTSSHSDILNQLLRLCGELSSYSDACSALLTLHFDEIYQMMLIQLRPFAACHLSGMCASRYHLHPSMNVDDMEKKIQTALAIPNDNLPCDLCKQLIEHFREILVANTTEEEFVQILKGICHQTGKFENDCLQIVEDNFKIIYKYLTEELNPSEICREINLCSNENIITDESLGLINERLGSPMIPVGTQTELQISDVIECKFCKTTVKLIQNEMKKPEFEHDIKAALEEACKLIPRKEKSKCYNFIDNYENALLELLINESDPQIICSMLQLCVNDQIEVISKIELCDFCQYVMHFLQEELENPQEQESIEDTVKKICKIIPAASQSKCEEFINQYSSLIITILAEELDPSLVCPTLKLCPSVQSSLNRCMHCRLLMRNFINNLNKNYNEENIKNNLKNLVSVQHSSDTTAVALELKVNYYEDVIEMMMAEFNFDESCVFLKFCDAKSIPLVDINESIESKEISDALTAIKTTVQENEQSCKLCELLVKLYEDELTKNATEVEIEEKLTKYCEKIKYKDLRSNCTHIVYKYVPIFADLLKKGANPKEICGLVKLCSISLPDTYSSDSLEQCHFCEAVVGSLKSISEDPYIELNMTSEINKVCKLFGKNKVVCHEIVTSLGPQLMNIIMEVPSWFYCAKINLCPYSEHFVDSKVCLNESSLCEDMKTAVFCDKLKYCRMNVWKSEKPNSTVV
ncbi:hypothetical protein PGB90_000012 [Kerria lacca]